MSVNKPPGVDAAPEIGRSLSRMWLRTGAMILSAENCLRQLWFQIRTVTDGRCHQIFKAIFCKEAA